MTIDPYEVDTFLESVSEVSRLVEGLKEGTISPEYIDTKVKRKELNCLKSLPAALPLPAANGAPAKLEELTPEEQRAREKEKEKKEKEKEEEQARLMAKVEELKMSRAKKLYARHKFEQYVASKDTTTYGTDYTRWDMWCPEDEEDDMINNICPNQPQFKAMEKDIEERHRRMIEQRQLGERARVAGNEAFRSGQYSEALRCYQRGIESHKTNMALHANAAMAALKIHCYVQAVEHCDKVLNIAEFFHNNLRDPLCVKAYMRRAQAYTALQQQSRAVKDLDAALDIDPENKELQVLLKKSKLALEENEKQKVLRKAVAKGKVAEGGGLSMDLEKLRQVEQLVGVLASEGEEANSSSSSKAEGGGEASIHTVNSGGAAPAASPDPAPEKKFSVVGLGGMSLGEKPKPKAKKAAAAATPEPMPAGTHSASRVSVAASAIVKLMDGDDACAVYFRECGGMQAASALISQTDSSANARVAVLGLLNAACQNDGNLTMLPSLNLPSICFNLLKESPASPSSPSADSDVASSPVGAALLLLCTAATNDDVRKAISNLVGTEDGLTVMFQIMSSSSVAVQTVALTLLGNCMVDKCTKEAMQKSVARSPVVSDCLQKLLVPAGIRGSPEHPLVQEKAMTLVSNMCGDAQLRQALASQEKVMSSITKLASASTASVAAEPARLAVRNSALTALYNLCLDASAQLAVQNGGYLPSLLALAALDEKDGLESAIGVTHRAAGVVSRCAKASKAQTELMKLGVVPRMLALAGTIIASKSNAPAAASTGALDAVVRLLAQLTAQNSACADAAVRALIDEHGVPTLIRVLSIGQPLATESVQGNASLCLGHVARYSEHLGALAAEDAVAPLVKVAYDGKGNSASKNAAIALAKMAQDGRMIERLRELHGLEIIYQYVKP